jgi:ribonuclease P protein component
VLPPANRLRTRQDFSRALRTGRRVPGRLVVLHLALTDRVEPPRVGLAVGRAVGTSVTRHRVARRLRHLLRARLVRLPAGALLVVRALPSAGPASSAQLGEALDAGLARVPTLAGPA